MGLNLLNPLGWDGYPKSAWDCDSLAVIASDGKDGCVLWTASPHVRLEIEECNMYSLADLGLDDAPWGISVWVGKYVYHNNSNPLGPDEGGDSEPKGVFRSPTDDEWIAIREGRCPWDDNDWRTSSGGDRLEAGVGEFGEGNES